MKKPDIENYGMRDMMLPVIMCVCFIASSILFLVQMIAKSQEENITDLYNAANQTKTTIMKQMEGDWQTLEGLAVSLQAQGIRDAGQIMETLRNINDKNAFIRMGYADIDGVGQMVAMDGDIQPIDLRGMEFFERALKGEKSISETFSDPYQEDSVNYFAVRVLDSENRATGVICAVHTSAVFRDIIDTPLLKSSGFSNIMDRHGEYVIKSTKDLRDDTLPENKENIAAHIQDGTSRSFEMRDGNGVRQMAVVLPLLEGQWYQISMVPVEVLRSRYIQTAIGIMAIIITACGLFIWLIDRQRRMGADNQKALMKLAYNDDLTGLRNFDGFKKSAETFLDGADDSSCLFWYADLKNFKYFNDVFGYEEGDRLLCLVGGFLVKQEGELCMSCRISADNFAGILRCGDVEVLEKGHEELLDFLRHSGMDNLPFLEIPVGVYEFRDGVQRQSVDVLVNYANMAHKIAKEKAGSAVVLYDEGIRSRILEDSALESEAELAIEQEEFKLYIQPKVNIQDGNRISGGEVLVRWQSPKRGLIPPNRFISLFEKSELIVKLDRYIFEHACRWYRDYVDRGGRPVNLAVNVSKVGLFRQDFIAYYSGMKEKYGIPDQKMELEFTENIMAVDTEQFSELVGRLQKKGFICSMDDFGSGYSSLNLLKDLPIDVLKLDILFFRKSKDIVREQIVVSNVINMARALGIRTIAEGVEHAATVDFLRKAGCDMIQGYVFSKPMPKEEFEKLLQKTDTLSMAE